MYHFESADAAYIHSINASCFEDIALRLFRYQYDRNKLYRQFTDALGIAPERVQSLSAIPFLPVSFFKSHIVKTGDWKEPELLFESSGTTGEMPARHYIKDAGLYREALLRGFRQFYGDPAQYAILALLPSYLERGNASLVHMARLLMEAGNNKDSGFYLDEWEDLAAILALVEAAGRPALLLGVTFALLDFAADRPMALPHIKVMETGGMKGRREEWTREQVHRFLSDRWDLGSVHSEYGMTELLSQAYAPSNGIFSPAAPMRVLVRELNDPLSVTETGTGCINIIDLANVHSCAFIATDDIGTVKDCGTFEVLGRMDGAALRGCSLMTA